MAVIEYVHIENFRSIRQLTLGGLEDYSPLLGLNSSGKSNVLRALNLFFNGYVDEERRPLNFVDDLSDYAPKGKKKVVSVTVGIGLSDDLHVRGQDEFQRLNGISDRIYIRRIWTLGPDKLTVVDSYEFGAEWDDLTAPDAEQLAAVLTHVRAVRFVYIPNHILPAQLIRSELGQTSLLAFEGVVSIESHPSMTYSPSWRRWASGSSEISLQRSSVVFLD